MHSLHQLFPSALLSTFTSAWHLLQILKDSKTLVMVRKPPFLVCTTSPWWPPMLMELSLVSQIVQQPWPQTKQLCSPCTWCQIQILAPRWWWQLNSLWWWQLNSLWWWQLNSLWWCNLNNQWWCKLNNRWWCQLKVSNLWLWWWWVPMVSLWWFRSLQLPLILMQLQLKLSDSLVLSITLNKWNNKSFL